MSIYSTIKPVGEEAEGEAAPAVTDVPADLVVDASGRESGVARELERHGFPAAPVEELKSRLDYATILVRPAAADWPQARR